jgi:hypothetical protein
VNQRLGRHDDEADPEHVPQPVKCARIYHHEPERDRPDRRDEKQQPQLELASIAPRTNKSSKVQKVHREGFRAAQQSTCRPERPALNPHARKRCEESDDGGARDKSHDVAGTREVYVRVYVRFVRTI